MTGAMGGPHLSLADDLWCIAHDHYTHQRQLNDVALKIGLAGCLLTELVGEGWATVVEGHVTGYDIRPFAPDVPFTTKAERLAPLPLTRAIWNAVMAEADRHPIKTWLTVISQTAIEQVTERLAEKGVLNRRNHANFQVAEAAIARLRYMLDHRHELPIQDQVLVAFADAVGLNGRILDGIRGAADYHTLLVKAVSESNVYGEIVGQTKAVIGASVLIGRKT